LDTDELISGAMERLRVPEQTAYSIRIARRAIQLTFAQLSTEGINMAQVEKQTLALALADVEYTLAADTQDILEVTYRDTSQADPTDLAVMRIARDEYHYIPDKLSPGRPTKFWLDRQLAAPVLRIWQAPDKATYQLDFYRIRRFRDVGGMTDNLDVPDRWLGLLIAGVAYYIGLTMPTLSQPARMELKEAWLDEMARILPEDRERSPMRLEPDLSCYARI
jgi:hypothetical protein